MSPRGGGVVATITVTFICAQTFLPLPLLPPHTYSSTSHLHTPSQQTRYYDTIVAEFRVQLQTIQHFHTGWLAQILKAARPL